MKCIILKCENQLGPRATEPKPCPTCLANYRYWLNKDDPQAIVRRQDNIEKYQDRMRHLATLPRGKSYRATIMRVIPTGGKK